MCTYIYIYIYIHREIDIDIDIVIIEEMVRRRQMLKRKERVKLRGAQRGERSLTT